MCWIFFSFVRYDVELYQRIEHLIGKKLPLYETVEEEVMVLVERVTQAQHHARQEMKELDERKRGSKRKGNDEEEGEDTEQSLGVQQKIRKKMGDRGGNRGGSQGGRGGSQGGKGNFKKKKFRGH